LASLPSELVGLAAGVLSGDRLSLSRAITLIESSHPRHVAQAQQLLAALAHERKQREAEKGNKSAAETAAATAPDGQQSPEQQEDTLQRKKRALRIGISGPPVSEEERELHLSAVCIALLFVCSTCCAFFLASPSLPVSILSPSAMHAALATAHC
jgi:hypothetical protein